MTIKEVMNSWFWLSFWNVIVSVGWNLTITVEIIITIGALIFGFFSLLEKKRC